MFELHRRWGKATLSQWLIRLRPSYCTTVHHKNPIAICSPCVALLSHDIPEERPIAPHFPCTKQGPEGASHFKLPSLKSITLQGVIRHIVTTERMLCDIQGICRMPVVTNSSIQGFIAGWRSSFLCMTRLQLSTKQLLASGPRTHSVSRERFLLNLELAIASAEVRASSSTELRRADTQTPTR